MHKYRIKFTKKLFSMTIFQYIVRLNFSLWYSAKIKIIFISLYSESCNFKMHFDLTLNIISIVPEVHGYGT